MKKIVTFLFTLCAFQYSFSQNNTAATFSKCSHFGISVAVRDLPDAPEYPEDRESKDAHHKRKPLGKINRNALSQEEDPIVQKTNGSKAMMPLIANWAGINGMFPPDPSGAAGPNHFVQAVNTSYRVYNKTGTPLIAAKNLSSLWTGSTNEGDPIVLYDKFADRWFISQFQNDNSVLIAISTSPDPTGTFYTYSFLPAAADFPDYLKFSIWPDGYYMSTNFNTQRMVVFERTKMLVEDASAGMIGVNVSNTFNISYAYEHATSSRLQTFTKGTHEIMLGFLIGNKYGSSCPRNLW